MMNNNINSMVNEYVFLRLADGDPTVTEGVMQILRDGAIARPLDHAAKVLLHAKSENELQGVEGSLQIMIRDVQHLAANRYQYLDPQHAAMYRQRTALYIYTLQKLIGKLSTWRLKGNKENHYVPLIRRRYQALINKAKAKGMDPSIVWRRCYQDSYQYPSPQYPELYSFQFLDEDAIKNLEFELEYQAAKEKRRTPIWQRDQQQKGEKLSGLKQTDVKILDKVISILKQRTGRAKLTFADIASNLEGFFALIGNIMHLQDRAQIMRVTETVMSRLLTLEQSVFRGVQKLNAKTTAILDKVTLAVKDKLGALALNVHYLVGHIEHFFNIVGAEMRVSDKSMIARVTEVIMQRDLGFAPLAKTSDRANKLAILNRAEAVR